MSGLPVQKSSASFSTENTQIKGRDIPIDYLRSCVIVLVVFLHAAIAYTTFSTFNAARYFESSAPIVDSVRWPFLDLFVLFFDTFFMPLLFFVSGLFTFHSLDRKGSRGFFTARLRRLGIPFLVGAVLIAPLAFLPSYLASTPESQTPYLLRFFTSDGWPVGPPWFLWMLLLFNGIVALAYRFAPDALARLRKPPTALAIFLVMIASFLALGLFIPTYYWISLGPFDFQPARLGLYFASFLLGMAAGTGQQWRTAGWPRHWGLWLGLGLFSFFVYIALFIEAVRLPGPAHQVAVGVTYATSCAGASLGFLGAFRKLVRRPRPIFEGVSDNSYGIYLIHYPFVLWIQFFLLAVVWPAWAKFGVAFVGALALSWGTSASIRRIPAVRRIL
ncbi:MAG: acyltransferase family protein [Chloroflexota bacterium]